jgi:hypothetical protein
VRKSDDKEGQLGRFKCSGEDTINTDLKEIFTGMWVAFN